MWIVRALCVGGGGGCEDFQNELLSSFMCVAVMDWGCGRTPGDGRDNIHIGNP